MMRTRGLLTMTGAGRKWSETIFPTLH
jgi:hypothetical protein